MKWLIPELSPAIGIRYQQNNDNNYDYSKTMNKSDGGSFMNKSLQSTTSSNVLANPSSITMKNTFLSGFLHNSTNNNNNNNIDANGNNSNLVNNKDTSMATTLTHSPTNNRPMSNMNNKNNNKLSPIPSSLKSKTGGRRSSLQYKLNFAMMKSNSIDDVPDTYKDVTDNFSFDSADDGVTINTASIIEASYRKIRLQKHAAIDSALLIMGRKSLRTSADKDSLGIPNKRNTTSILPGQSLNRWKS